MDPRGDHATKCKHGFGITHRHNSLRNCIARQLFKPSGLAYRLEVSFLIPDTAHRPADILVQAGPPPPGALPERPTAYDVTVRSPFRSGIINKAAKQRAGAAEAADADKVQTLNRTLRDALLIAATDPIPPLDWTFTPLAFDTLGAPSARTVSVIEVHAQKIAFRSCMSYAAAKSRIEQHLSYSIGQARPRLFYLAFRLMPRTFPTQYKYDNCSMYLEATLEIK